MQYEQTFNANPHKVEEVDERTPEEVYDNLRSLGHQANDILDALLEEFWKDDIEDVFGFADEDSDDYILYHRLTEEERHEYFELQKQADELEGKMVGASFEEQDRLREGFGEKYAKMEDLIEKYRTDEDSEEDEA